jgi:type II secretory pathway pseudopilin PulG
MLARLQREAGWTLVELLVTMALMLLVLGAIMTSLEQTQAADRTNAVQNEIAEGLRAGTDRAARDFRNAGNSPLAPTSPIERAQPNDLVFETVDPAGPGSGTNAASVRRVRYCLELSNPERAKLWRQLLRSPTTALPPLSSATGCPDPSFGSQTVVSDLISNDAKGQSRPAFSYDASVLKDITAISLNLFGDTDPSRNPLEQSLSTTLFLRNQNRAPAASFTATVEGNRHVLLNGGASSDPDGESLTYEWYYDGTKRSQSSESLDYTAATTGDHTFKLIVTDPNGLTDTFSQTVTDK